MKTIISLQTCYCHDASALDKVFGVELLARVYPAVAVNYDLLKVNRYFRSLLRFAVTPTWMIGHYSGPDRAAQHDLNGIADGFAGDFRCMPSPIFSPYKKPIYPNVRW